MQISESPMQNAFQILSPLRSALPLPECSAARQTGKEYGHCVVVGDWLCYWPTIYSLTSCFPLCLSPLSLHERSVCLSPRIVVYVNMSARPSVHLPPGLLRVTLSLLLSSSPLPRLSVSSFVLVIVAPPLRHIHKPLRIPLSSLLHCWCHSCSVTRLLDSHPRGRNYRGVSG